MLQATLVVVLQVELAMQVVARLAKLLAKLVVVQLATQVEQVELVVGQLFDRSNSIVGRPIGQLAILRV